MHGQVLVLVEAAFFWQHITNASCKKQPAEHTAIADVEMCTYLCRCCRLAKHKVQQ